MLVLTFLAPNSLPCADGAVKNLLTHSLQKNYESTILSKFLWSVKLPILVTVQTVIQNITWKELVLCWLF